MCCGGQDDEVREYGNVTFCVVGDGKVMYEQEQVSAGDNVYSVSLDITSVNVLELVVDFGEDFDIGDHADWAGAYLIRKK